MAPAAAGEAAETAATMVAATPTVAETGAAASPAADGTTGADAPDAYREAPDRKESAQTSTAAAIRDAAQRDRTDRDIALLALRLAERVRATRRGDDATLALADAVFDWAAAVLLA